MRIVVGVVVAWRIFTYTQMTTMRKRAISKRTDRTQKHLHTQTGTKALALNYRRLFVCRTPLRDGFLLSE